MLLPDFEAEEFVRTTGFDSVVTWDDTRGPEPGVKDAFARLPRLGRDPVIAVDDELSYAHFALLAVYLGTRRPVLASSLLGPLRLLKSAHEQEVMTRAGELVSKGIDAMIELAEPGMSEKQLCNALESSLRDNGAESVDFVMVQAGASAAAPHHEAGLGLLREGESVLADIAVRLDGYFSDITQQVFLGEPPADYVHAYETVSAAQEAGVKASVVGATAQDVDRAAAAVLVEAGYERQSRTGHGIGLDVHEAPSVVEGNLMQLRPGMTFTVEPGIYVPGRFGIRFEDTVLVTNDGPRRLTRGNRPLQAKI
jgi:Xaa-Pro aminopeptidase